MTKIYTKISSLATILASSQMSRIKLGPEFCHCAMCLLVSLCRIVLGYRQTQYSLQNYILRVFFEISLVIGDIKSPFWPVYVIQNGGRDLVKQTWWNFEYSNFHTKFTFVRRFNITAIVVTSSLSYGGLKSPRLDRLLNSIFRLTTEKSST